MSEYQLATAEGRSLLFRPVMHGPRPQIQVAILSTRGNVMEAVTIEAGDVLGLCRGSARVARVAAARFKTQLERERTAAAKRYRAALARNPWQQEARRQREERGLR